MKYLSIVFIGVLLNFLFLNHVFSQTQTWSEQGIRNIVIEELGGVDTQSIKTLIEQEKIGFEKDFNTKLSDQQNFIEIIGLFAAVLALIIINIGIVKSAKTFLSAISLTIALTSSMVIFATLIHWFFSSDGLGNKVWLLIIAFLVLFSLFIFAYKRDSNFIECDHD